MPDSTITKKALAQALKELMREMSIEKINVAFICQRCGMKRQSFYYHFRDKYHLINWIFDSEIGAVLRDSPDAAQEDPWDKFRQLCDYFYANRVFYRSALQVKGQDSLYYRVVVFRAPLQGLCYTVRDVVDRCITPTTRWFKKGSNHSPLQFC